MDTIMAVLSIIITVFVVIVGAVLAVLTVFELIVQKDITALFLSEGFNVGKKFRAFLKPDHDKIAIVLEEKQTGEQHLIDRVLERACFLYFYSANEVFIYNEITKSVKIKRKSQEVAS